MSLTDEYARELAAFPPGLRALVEAELAAGNAIADIGHHFPAAPCGAFILLARPVGTRLRASDDDLSFYERRGSAYSGEFTDRQRHFFVLEPPRTEEPPAPTRRSKPESPPPDAPVPAEPAKPVSTAKDRFLASMRIDYERWREGVGYDLALLKTLAPDARASIERLLVARARNDWRDVEALAALDTPGARTALADVLACGPLRQRLAVLRHAPALVPPGTRVQVLRRAIEEAADTGELPPFLELLAGQRDPELEAALHRGIRDGAGGPAVHFAAMLCYWHGLATTSFDWKQRPFFLRFNTTDRAAREAAYAELCVRLGSTGKGRP